MMQGWAGWVGENEKTDCVLAEVNRGKCRHPLVDANELRHDLKYEVSHKPGRLSTFCDCSCGNDSARALSRMANGSRRLRRKGNTKL